MVIPYVLYEQVVYNLVTKYADGLAQQGAKILGSGYGHKNQLLGHSGIMHQIDVHIEYLSKDGTHRLKLVECKHLSQSKIDLSTTLTFFARICDIQSERGVSIKVDGNLFTTVGYTKPATKFAEAHGIATNSAHLNRETGSITFAEGSAVMLETIQLKASAPNLANNK